jgi:flagellar hook-associated protein 1 FlgK
MVSTFGGLNTLLRSLQAHQEALNVTNHNIANANTDGYSRQVANLAATPAYTAPGANRPSGMALQVGTGVEVTEVRRARDVYLDLEFRAQSQRGARWQTLADGLRQIEGIMGEPGENGLQQRVTAFFNAWSDLANNPESTAVRATVRAEGEALAASFNETGRLLEQARQGFDTAVTGKLAEAGDLAAEVASLNGQIARLAALGDQPNDLRDRRDLVLDRLVDLTGATYKETASGSVTVTLGGRVLVADDRATSLVVETRTTAGGGLVRQAFWPQDGAAVTIDGGTLAGLIELRDRIVPEQARQLDLLASSIANAVNTLHRQGAGLDATAIVADFFDPMTSTTPLSQTGLGRELSSGVVTIGGQVVTVDPARQSLDDVMNALALAADAATGSPPGTTTWSRDPASGRLALTYAGTAGLTFGAAADTSNLLRVLGLEGAPATANAGPPPSITVDSTAPLALVSASRMAVDPAVKADLAAIAAAARPASGAVPPGDNSNALAIAALQRQAFASLDGATFVDYYAGTIGTLGAASRQAEATAENQQLLAEHLVQRRESTSGVSLDEEAMRLIQYQRAYQAASRGITVLDELLETIITRMGRAGT